MKSCDALIYCLSSLAGSARATGRPRGLTMFSHPAAAFKARRQAASECAPARHRWPRRVRRPDVPGPPSSPGGLRRRSRPSPSPPAMPKAALRASPGPLTMQPMTATSRSSSRASSSGRRASRRRSTSTAKRSRSMRVRPQVGQEITPGSAPGQPQAAPGSRGPPAPPPPGRR